MTASRLINLVWTKSCFCFLAEHNFLRENMWEHMWQSDTLTQENPGTCNLPKTMLVAFRWRSRVSLTCRHAHCFCCQMVVSINGGTPLSLEGLYGKFPWWPVLRCTPVTSEISKWIQSESPEPDARRRARARSGVRSLLPFPAANWSSKWPMSSTQGDSRIVEIGRWRMIDNIINYKKWLQEINYNILW